MSTNPNDAYEANVIGRSLTPFQNGYKQGFHDGEIGLARKVLAVSSGVRKMRGMTQAKRLELLTEKMMEIIPDDIGIAEATLEDPNAKP